MGIKDRDQANREAPADPRSAEEILAEDPPTADRPDVTEKTALRFGALNFDLSPMVP